MRMQRSQKCRLLASPRSRLAAIEAPRFRPLPRVPLPHVPPRVPSPGCLPSCPPLGALPWVFTFHSLGSLPWLSQFGDAPDLLHSALLSLVRQTVSDPAIRRSGVSHVLDILSTGLSTVPSLWSWAGILGAGAAALTELFWEDHG